MTEAALNVEAVRGRIKEGLETWVNGGPDCRQECRGLAATVRIEEETEKLIASAQRIKWGEPEVREAEGEANAALAEQRAKPAPLRRLGPGQDFFISPKTRQGDPRRLVEREVAKIPVRKPGLVIDGAADKAAKEKLIAELAEIFNSDKTEERLRYNRRKAEIAEVLDVTQMDVHRSVMLYVETQKKAKTELTQSQKVISLADKLQLWVDPMDKAAHASIVVGKHYENYRLGDGSFEDWVRAEYGRRHWVEIDRRRVPAVLGNQVLHEGIATMKAMAAGYCQIEPALRVGGVPGEVWIDLGRDDWELVRVSVKGWGLFISGEPGVRFVRKPGMLALPMPVHGAKIEELRPFLNVRREDFVLNVVGCLGR